MAEFAGKIQTSMEISDLLGIRMQALRGKETNNNNCNYFPLYFSVGIHFILFVKLYLQRLKQKIHWGERWLNLA